MKHSSFTDLHANNLLGIKDQSVYHLASAMLSTARATEGLPAGDFSFDHLKAIHKHLVQDLHDWAGLPRTINPHGTRTDASRIEELTSRALTNLTSTPANKMSNDDFAVKASICYANLMAINPFLDGNSRAARSFLKEYAQSIGRDIKWEQLESETFNFAVDRAMSGDISLLSNQLKSAVINRDLFDEYNAEAVNNKTLEIAAFAGITPQAMEASAAQRPTLQALAQAVTRRLVNDLELHSKGLPSKLDWDKSSIKYEVAGHSNANLLDSGIANVLSNSEPAPPTKSQSQRLG